MSTEPSAPAEVQAFVAVQADSGLIPDDEAARGDDDRSIRCLEIYRGRVGKNHRAVNAADDFGLCRW